MRLIKRFCPVNHPKKDNFLDDRSKTNSTECFKKIIKNTPVLHNLSNFNQSSSNTTLFWQVSKSKTLQLFFAKKTALYTEWDQMLGPISISKVDQISLQYICLRGKI